MFGARMLRILFRSSLSNDSLYMLVNLTNVSKRFAGHSHWQNVKHVKEANDRIKAKTSQFYCHAINQAIKDGKGIRDPKMNSRLATLMAQAKANNVSQATLDRFLKNTESGEPFIVEIQAQGGLFVLAEVITANRTNERYKLAGIVKKFGCTILTSPGTIINNFNHIGVISVYGGPGTNLPDLNVATTLGIDVGAHEVEALNVDDKLAFKFLCDPIELYQMRICLENDYNLTILDAEDVYIPKHLVRVSKQSYHNLGEMYEKIRNFNDCVQRIFDNATVEDD